MDPFLGLEDTPSHDLYSFLAVYWVIWPLCDSPRKIQTLTRICQLKPYSNSKNMTDLENPSQTVCNGDQTGRTLGLTTHFSERSSKVCVNKLAKRKGSPGKYAVWRDKNFWWVRWKTRESQLADKRRYCCDAERLVRIGTKSSRTMSKITAYA